MKFKVVKATEDLCFVECDRCHQLTLFGAYEAELVSAIESEEVWLCKACSLEDVVKSLHTVILILSEDNKCKSNESAKKKSDEVSDSDSDSVLVNSDTEGEQEAEEHSVKKSSAWKVKRRKSTSVVLNKSDKAVTIKNQSVCLPVENKENNLESVPSSDQESEKCIPSSCKPEDKAVFLVGDSNVRNLHWRLHKLIGRQCQYRMRYFRGASMKGVSEKLELVLMEFLAATKVKDVLLLIHAGTNDVGRTSVSEFLKVLVEMETSVKRFGEVNGVNIKLCFCTVPERDDADEGKKMDVLKFNDILLQPSTARSVIDLRKFQILKFLWSDGVHYSEKGACLVAAGVNCGIRHFLGIGVHPAFQAYICREASSAVD